MLADKFAVILREAEDKISALDFYGHDFGMSRLGYIIVPYLLRQKIRSIKEERLNMENGPYPPRKDGGYGWFIVEETVDESEICAEYDSGCNIVGDDSGNTSYIYYYWIGKYFDLSVYRTGTWWMCENGIPQKSVNGVVPKEALSEEDAAHLIKYRYTCQNAAVDSRRSCILLNSNNLSGAGKTTLLQIMGTLDKPDGGRIILNGTEVNRLKDRYRQ